MVGCTNLIRRSVSVRSGGEGAVSDIPSPFFAGGGCPRRMMRINGIWEKGEDRSQGAHGLDCFYVCYDIMRLI